MAGSAQDRYGTVEGLFKSSSGKKFIFPSDFSHEPVVFLFLSPECPLCINYNAILSDMHKRYEGRIKFYGVFSGKTNKRGIVEKYGKKYGINFPLLIDKNYKIATALHAQITPECVLVDQHGNVRYTGAIDDRAPALGIFKNKALSNYLENAIDTVLSGQPLQVNYIKASGCFIFP